MTIQWCFTHNRQAFESLFDDTVWRCGRVKSSEGECVDVAEMIPVRADTELYAKDGCERCDTQGIYSCQAFPCEHGGHMCEVCDGRGWVFRRVGGER